jgi:hypothetical protein
VKFKEVGEQLEDAKRPEAGTAGRRKLLQSDSPYREYVDPDQR